MNTTTRKAQHVAWQLTKDTLDLALYALVATDGHLPRKDLETKLSTHINAISKSINRLRDAGKIFTVRTLRHTTLYTSTYANTHDIEPADRELRHQTVQGAYPEDIEVLALYQTLNALWPTRHSHTLKLTG